MEDEKSRPCLPLFFLLQSPFLPLEKGFDGDFTQSYGHFKPFRSSLAHAKPIQPDFCCCSAEMEYNKSGPFQTLLGLFPSPFLSSEKYFDSDFTQSYGHFKQLRSLLARTYPFQALFCCGSTEMEEKQLYPLQILSVALQIPSCLMEK
jgi:hypothetical protein